jgi:TP901 family phage tail tape measure protein
MANINAQFNYSANFGPVIGQMQKLAAEANVLNNTLQNLDKQSVGLKSNLAGAFASDIGKIGGWNAKMVELTDSVDQFGQSLLKQKLTLKQYAQEAIGAFSKSSNAHKLAVREVSREMSQLVTLGKGMDGKQMGMMITPATINLKDFNTQLAVSQKQWSIFNNLVQDGTTHLINFGKNTQWAGRQITVGLTVPLTIYGNAVSKIFREVDAELTRFKKVYGSDLGSTSAEVTERMVSDVRNIAIEFSRSFGIAAKETASLAADLAATGLEGQRLLSSLRETTRLAVLGDVSNQDAMKTTLSLQNAFKISTDELASSVNFLNAVENQTSLSLQDLTTAIPKAGPVVKSLGGDVKDLSLLMVALKEGGISAAEGANALKSGMASLINPTKQATMTAKQYGIDINGIVQANRGQLMPTIIAFQQQLQLLDEFGKAQVIENVFGKYQFARLSALFDNLNASASQTNAVLGLMGKSNKELAATAYQEMDTLMNSASKRFQRAIEGIKAQFISIGGSITSAITPILENITGKIQKAIEFFQNLPKPVKSFIKVATGLTAIAGPIIMMVGIFSNFLGYIGKGAMGMVNLGRRMAGIPVQKFEMLTDTQIMAQKATNELSLSFDRERSSVERLNQALGIYRQNLVDAIALNPAFVNRQMPSVPATTPTAQMQRGGSAWVPGSGDGDKVPAMLEPGEYVVNKKAAAKYSGTLDQMNFQSAPRFQKGGRMPGYADTSYLPYESVLGMDKKAEPFIGPLPQISYTLQGGYRPGGYTPMLGYPFSSKESAESFQSTRRDYQGSGSRITRDINDPQQKAYADWIEGHNSNQFRTGTGVMKRMDMEGHREQMLKSMGPISQSIPLYRGTVLKEKGANEFSGVGARELLMYIKNGMFEKAMGKKIQWSDMQSFSSNPNIASYNKFIESWTNPSNTNSKKAADRQLASMDMLPIVFRLASAQGQNGFNLSSRAMVQEVMGKPVDEKEWVLNNPSGTITGIRQDMGTKNYIVDLMQKGGRVQSHAGKSFPGAPTVDVNPFKLVGMGGVNEDNPIAGLDKQSGMFYKQISNNRGMNTNAMLAEAVFSQLYRSGLFGSNVTGIDQRVYNANTGNKTMPVLGSSFVQGLKTGEKLFDSKSAQLNRPTPFAKGVVNKKAIEGMLASQILGNADTHSGNFGISGGKIMMLDNTANLFTDATGNQRRTSKALNDFSYNPDTAGLDRAGTQAYGKMGSKKADSHVIGYLNSVLGNLNSGNYIAQSINLATQGSPELLKNLNDYATKKSGGASKSYEQLLTSMISMRTQKLMQEFYLDEDDMSLVGSDTKKMRLQSNAEESFRAPFQRTDKEFETIYKWIGGELDYFRRRKNVKGRWTDSEKFDAERYAELLGIMRSVPEGTKMMRGSLLNPGMSGEMSKESQLAMLTAIQTGDYGSLYGMDISFNDFASFASDFMGPAYGPRGMKGGVSRFSQVAYNKLYRGVHNRNTEKGRFFDDIERSRATGKESKYGSSPVMYDFTAGPNTQGRDISMGDPSTGAPYPKYRDSWVKEVPDEINEILTYGAQGTITGVSSDLQSRQPIIHMQGKQMGGRINGYAAKSGSFYPMFVSGGKGLSKTAAPQDWQNAFKLANETPYIKDRISSAQKYVGALGKEASLLEIAHTGNNPYMNFLGEKAKNWTGNEMFEVGLINRFINFIDDDSGAVADFAQKHVGSARKKQPTTSAQATALRNGLGKAIQHSKDKGAPKGSSIVNWMPRVYEFLNDPKNRNYYDKKIRIKDFDKDRKLTPIKTFDDEISKKAKQSIRKSAGMQLGGRMKGYASETATWAKKAAAPKAYAGVLQNIPNWATKPNEYQAIVEALRAAGIPESDRLASYYIQDVLAHINPSTTNANGVYEKVWAAANLMKDSQVYNVFLETLNSRKDIGGLLNPSTVSRVAAASGLPTSVVQAELTKLADGVHPKTATGAKVMMTLARMFPSKTSPGMPIAVAAGMGARLQGNFYDTLGQRALPSNLPNITVRSYDPKGAGAPTSSTQGSRVGSTGLIMPSGAIRPSMVMPNIQSIPSAAGGTGTSATVKVDGMGNVLSNGIDDMVANTITGQPIAVSSKELLAIGPNGGIAGVTSPGDEARGKIVHPMGTALMRGKNFQQKRIKGFDQTTQQFGVPGGLIGPATREQAAQNTEPVYEGQINPGRMDKFAASIGFLTSGVYTLNTAFQQFTSSTAEGADKFTKLAAATTLAITGIQGVSQMLVDNGKIQAMQNKAQMMQGPGASKMSSGMGKMLGVGSKALGMLGGPMGMIATSVAISAVNKGIAMYQAAVQKAKAAGAGMFKDPIEGAKLLGITLKDTSAIAQTYSKIAEGLGMKGTGKGAYDKTYADVVKKDYGDLIDSLKIVLNQEEKRNKLLLTYINLTQKGFNAADAKEYVKEIARQSGSMSAFNSINLDNLKTSTEVANQVVASTKALMSSIGKVDSNLIGKYINKKTGTIYNTQEEADAARKQDSSFWQRGNAAGGVFSDYKQIDENTASTLSAGVLGSMSSLGLDEKQMGEAIAGALKTAYSIAATDPSAANQAGAMILEHLASGTAEQQEAANASILEMMKEAGASASDLGYNFVLGGGLTEMANDVEGKFGDMGPKFSNAILSAIQSGNIDMVNEMLEQSGGDPSPEVMQDFVNKVAKIQALAKIDLEVDIQLEQTKKQLEDIKTELGKTFDALIASKQAEIDLENKRHEQSMKNLDREAQRIALKKEALSKNTEYYLDQLQKEKEAEDYYSNQRKTGLGGLKALSQGDVFGFIGAQMEAATTADQFGRDRSIQNIKDTSDAAQEKLDQELKGIEDRKAAEAARHEAELANIEAEIEFLNQKRAISVGAAEKAISKIEKVVAMSPTDPGYQAAVQEAMSLATTAGMEASQVLQNVDTSSMTKEELVNFNKVKQDLGLAVSTFTADTETALDVIGQDIEAITKNIADSLGASGDILKEVVDALTQPVNPNSVLAKIEQLAGIDVGTGPGGVTGQAGAGNASITPTGGSTIPGGPPATPKNASAGFWYQDPTTSLWWKYGKNNQWASTSGQKDAPSLRTGQLAAGQWTPMADGGMLSGPGTGTSDSIPIMASNGEYVLRADIVKRIGKKKLDQINRGDFAMGGLVGSMSVMQSAPGYANGGFVGSMPSMPSAPGMAAGGFVGSSAPSAPKYNVPTAGVSASPSPIAQMAGGGMVGGSSASHSAPTTNFNFNGAGMDMVMHHVNKQMGGRINSNSRRIG